MIIMSTTTTITTTPTSTKMMMTMTTMTMMRMMVVSKKMMIACSVIGVCDNNIDKKGFLDSPGYPDPPPDGVTCEWRVTSPKGEIIYIRPDENDTAHALPNCSSGLLHVR